MNNFKTIAKAVYAEMLTRDNKPEMPTGLKALDNLLWGFKRGQTTILGGRTSQGKTALQLFIAHSLADQGKKVAIFSLEMTKEENVERLLSTQTGINNETMMRGMLTNEQKETIKTAIDFIPDDNGLYIHDNIGYEWGQVEKYVKENKPDIIFVDYVQMTSAENEKDERLVWSQYTRESKRMAKQYNMAVVLGSQIGRKGVTDKYGDIPALQHLKGTGVLEENADVVMIVHWWWKYKAEKDEIGTPYGINEYAIFIAKNRSGRSGVANVLFYPETYKFTDIKTEPKQLGWESEKGDI